MIPGIGLSLIWYAVPVSENWRSILGFTGFALVVFGSIGWLCSHFDIIRRFRHSPKGKHPMTFLFVGVIGALISIGIWALVKTPDKKGESMGKQTPPPPSIATHGQGSPILTGDHANLTQNFNFNQNPDFVPGTNITPSGLTRAFPFGWIVFSPLEGTRFTMEMDPAIQGVKFDSGFVDGIQCTPNVVNRTVTWILNNPSFRTINGVRTVLSVQGGRIEQTVPMNIGQEWGISPVTVSGEPEMVVVTLSDNQRTPKFVLGFRIHDSMARPR